MPTPRILVVNLGTPRAPESAAVAAFLREFLADPLVTGLPPWLWRPLLFGLIVPRRAPRVAELYASIWTAEGSPLAIGTARIAAQLRETLGAGIEVDAVYRYGQPSLESALATHDFAAPLVVAPLFPQATAATTGTIEERVAEHARIGGREVDIARVAPDDPRYVSALVARVRETLRAARLDSPHLLVSFHGIPQRIDRREGRVYSRACAATTAALAAALAWPSDRLTLAYQSRFGPEPWLTPATDATLVALAHRGVHELLVVCPGFLSEGLETLEEIGVRARERFLGAGGRAFALVPAAGDHPEFIAALAAEVDAALGRRK